MKSHQNFHTYTISWDFFFGIVENFNYGQIRNHLMIFSSCHIYFSVTRSIEMAENNRHVHTPVFQVRIEDVCTLFIIRLITQLPTLDWKSFLEVNTRYISSHYIIVMRYLNKLTCLQLTRVLEKQFHKMWAYMHS